MAARIAQFSTTVEMIDPGSTRRSIGGASLAGIIALAAIPDRNVNVSSSTRRRMLGKSAEAASTSASCSAWVAAGSR